MSLTFSHEVIAVWKKTKKEYDFLQYNVRNHRWNFIDAPQIQGIQLVYNHDIITRHSFIYLFNRRRINFVVSCRILKYANQDRWICVVNLENSRLVNSRGTTLKHADLVEIVAPPNLDLGRWQSPPPSPPVTEYSIDDIQPNMNLISEIPQSINTIVTNALATHYLPNSMLTMVSPNLEVNQRMSLLGASFMHGAFNSIIEYETTRKMPKHIAEIILKDAKQSGALCPITMENIGEKKCAITSCYHVFDYEAMNTWHKDHKQCPVCKQICSLTVVDV